MNLFDKLRSLLPGRKYRNKPGGLAWIKGMQQFPELNGRIVTTLTVDGDGHWHIEPTQVVHRLWLVFTVTSSIYAIDDELLEPLKDPPHDARDESLAYLPPVPAYDAPRPTLIEEPVSPPARKTAPTQRAGQG